MTSTDFLQGIRESLAPVKSFPLPGADLDYREWISLNCPGAASSALAPHHERAWEWWEALQPGVKPPALIECWFRGAGKSTTVELALARQAVKAERRFALYISSTQKSANRHVGSVATTMQSVGIKRLVSVYGHSQGWKADMLRTHNGFNVLALGLDTAVRGIKLDEFRPDIIVLDDIDELGDSLEIVQGKFEILTQSLLNAGSVDVATAFFQNAIHQHSLMTGCIEGTKDMLRRRVQSPIVKAVENLVWEKFVNAEGRTEYRILSGTANWPERKSLKVCEEEMNDQGIISFLRECQHDVTVGGRFFDEWNVKIHVCHEDEAGVMPHFTFIGGYDWGRGAPCCFLLAAVDEQGGITIIDEVYEPGLTNPEQAQAVEDCLNRWKHLGVSKANVTIYADPSMWALKSDHSGRKIADVQAFLAKGLRFVKASNARRWGNMRQYLKETVSRWVGEAFQKIPCLRILTGKCPNLIRTIPAQVTDPHDVEDLDTHGEDHAVDALRYLLASKPRPSRPDPNSSSGETPPGPTDHTPQRLRKPKQSQVISV
ncbi:MAG: hypothetical protein V4671_15870 [Armatimonadota bacterium]